jgi:hypothetical protein
MGRNPKASGGGSMITIIATIVIVAGVALYLLDPELIQNIAATIARWLRFGR